MNVSVQIDDRVRLMASVLLLTKFVSENPGSKPHPLRVETLEFLREHDSHPCVEACRGLPRRHWMSAFYCCAVQLRRDGSVFSLPKLDGSHEGEDDFADFEQAGYPALLSRFREDTGIDSLWRRTDELWSEAVHDCRTLLGDSNLDEFVELCFGRVRHKLVFVPNPLDPPTFGFGPSDGQTAYCIMGPPWVPQDTADAVRYASYGRSLAYVAFHELAHSLWNDARNQCPSIVNETGAWDHSMVLKGYFPKMYESWSGRLDEIVIRALTALYCKELEGEPAAQLMLKKEKDESGIDVIDRVFLCLHHYIQRRRCGEYSGLVEYLPVLAKEVQKSVSK